MSRSNSERWNMATFSAKIRFGEVSSRKCLRLRFAKNSECLEKLPRSDSRRSLTRRNPHRPRRKTCSSTSWATRVRLRKPTAQPMAHSKVKTCLQTFLVEVVPQLHRRRPSNQHLGHSRMSPISWICSIPDRLALQLQHSQARPHKQDPWTSSGACLPRRNLQRQQLLRARPLIPYTTRTTYKSPSR